MLKLGDIGFKGLYLGDTKFKKAYLGTDLVFNATPTFLEYIETDGKSYINTGYLPNEKTYVEYTFEVINASSTANHQGLFGSRKDQTVEGYQFNVFVRSAKYLRIDWGVYTGELTAYSLNTKYTIKAGLGEVYLDDELVKTYTVPATGTSSYSMYLGNFNNTGKPYTSGSIQRIYGFKVYENNVLLHDFRPCISPSGKVGMYDSITGQYFYNQGTGEFKAGGRFVNSILFDGASWIDTGIVHQTCTIEVDLRFEETGTRQLMGFGGSTSHYWGKGANSQTFEWFSGTNALDRTLVILEFNTDNTTAPTLTKYADGKTSATSTGSTISSGTYSIGNVAMTTVKYWCTCEVWNQKTYIGGEIVQDLRPYVDENGVACFKDIVTNTLFYNKGTGTLTYME